MTTHHSVMTSSLRFKKKREIGKFGDFSSDIDYNSKANVFRDMFRSILMRLYRWCIVYGPWMCYYILTCSILR